MKLGSSYLMVKNLTAQKNTNGKDGWHKIAPEYLMKSKGKMNENENWTGAGVVSKSFLVARVDPSPQKLPFFAVQDLRNESKVSSVALRLSFYLSGYLFCALTFIVCWFRFFISLLLLLYFCTIFLVCCKGNVPCEVILLCISTESNSFCGFCWGKKL